MTEPAGLHSKAVLQACAGWEDWPRHHLMHRHDSRSLMCRLCHADPGACCLSRCCIQGQDTQGMWPLTVSLCCRLLSALALGAFNGPILRWQVALLLQSLLQA